MCFIWLGSELVLKIPVYFFPIGVKTSIFDIARVGINQTSTVGAGLWELLRANAINIFLP